MDGGDRSFSPSGHSTHQYSQPASSVQREPQDSSWGSSSARPSHSPAGYGDSLSGPRDLHFQNNSGQRASVYSAQSLRGAAPSYAHPSLHRSSSSPGGYSLPRPPTLLEASPSAVSSSPNLQSSSRYLAERKRRLSSLASSPERQPSRRVTAAPSELLRDSLIRRSVTSPSLYSTGTEVSIPQFSNMSSGAASASSSTPANQPVLIDLTGDDDSPSRPASSSSRVPDNGDGGRRMSRSGAGFHMDEIVLPTWQPDNEVTNCPVCGLKFSWYFRKHHCRKCGRVVCNNCSPHKITIPRQFIVKPPTTIDLTGADDNGSPVPDNFWGGAEVRVCNPCVPDPNFSPPVHPNSPHQHQPSQMPGWHPYSFGGQTDINAGPASGHHAPVGNNGQSNTTYPGYVYQPGQLPHLPGQNIQGQPNHSYSQYQFRNPSTVRDLWPPTAPPHPSTVLIPPSAPHQHHSQQPHHTARQNPLSYAFRGLPLNPFPWASGTDGSSDSQSGSPLDLPYRNMAPARPRREIPEEDECPVCGEELPPRGPDGSTTDRENHVEDCIRNRSFGASTPAQSTPVNQPAGTPPVGSFPSSSARRRLTGAGRMLKYRATEKDCVDEDTGSGQECIICFEEFEVGEMMGRLECLCKFHHDCIRKWWETRGDGSCPTHQLHE